MFDLFMKQFISDLEYQGYSPKTIKVYKLINSNLIEAINKPVQKITTEDIKNYFTNYEIKHKISKTTLNNYQRYAKSYFKWLYENKIISSNPCDNLKNIKTPKTMKEHFSQEEMEIIRKTAKDIRDKAIIEFLYSSGVRISELVALNKKDINFITNTVIVKGKGNKERKVYFSNQAKELLEQYLITRKDKNEALFVNKRKPYNRANQSSIAGALGRIGFRCGVHIFPHRFRHTCATVLLERGMSIEEVAKILGHEKIQTTLIYVKLNDNQLRENYHRCMDF